MATIDKPTLVTPDLGTPTAGVLTNCTGTATNLTAGKGVVLNTARAINGVNFDGSAPITIPSIWITAAPTTQTGTGLIVSLTYGESITLGDLLYISAANTVLQADATSIATAEFPCMGLALATASSGAHDVLLMGTYKDSTKWTGGTALTVGGICYLSATEAGLTQVQPSSADNIIQVVGIAIDTDTILFRPSPDFITHT